MQSIYCLLCILRHCAHLIRPGRQDIFISLRCHQLTSHTQRAAGFIHYSTALENSIIEFHLVD